jgi:hypothetical protein
VIIDGALYLVKDGAIYDAQGKLVRWARSQIAAL